MAKKKMSPKELRAQKELEKKNKFKQQEADREKARVEEEARAQEEKEKREYEARIKKIESQDENKGKISKSRAKAAGLKSTFVLDNDKVLMTSFGRGAEAKPEKYVINGIVSEASEASVLDVTPIRYDFGISGRLIRDAKTNNPLHQVENMGGQKRQDQIQCRDELEKLYFGQTFDDNIHIQLIYQILDIEKILAVHANNIIYTIDNLLRKDEEEHDDLVGYMTTAKYENYIKNEKSQVFFELLEKQQLAYFGSVLLPVDKTGKKIKDKKELEEHYRKCYYILSALGMVRQATAHGNRDTRGEIYQLEDTKKEAGIAMVKVLDDLYAERVSELNRNFCSRANKDIFILCKVMGVETAEEQERLVKAYYDFIVLKSFKNAGFSVKKVREIMIDKHAQEIADKEYDSVRQKMNHILDFIISEHYRNGEGAERAERLIERLRSCQKESEKEVCYQYEADYIWGVYREKIERDVLRMMNGDYIKNIPDGQVTSEMLGNVVVSEKALKFSELIYTLTLFLDGKEINDLLTQLISRFDNISSFFDVIESQGLPANIDKKYEIFKRSKQVSQELRVINSFARMTEEDPNAKPELFVEAALVLGYDEDEDTLREYIYDLLDKDNRPRINGKPDNNFRNFIINNVIVSSRFKYLVRYGNPRKIRKLAENRKVIDFVLKDIPDEQIVAYFNSCNDAKANFFPKMRDDLAEKITGLHFMDFKDVNVSNKASDAKQADKERKKNIVRLYLTVLYLLQKNLVYVNARYYMAFHCAERDGMLKNPDKYHPNDVFFNWADIATDFLNEYGYAKKKPKRNRQLMQDIANSDPWALGAYRNCAEHLTAIRNADVYIGDIREFHSYFELYHYLVQRHLIAQYKHDCNTDSKKIEGTKIMSEERVQGKLLQYFDMVERYKTYCKDFVKALNVPFSYNLARFKNLSINELFDRNNYLPDKKQLIGPEEE